MRTPMIAGNWKMNTTVAEAIELVSGMRLGLDEIEGVDKVICPPFISLAVVYGLIKGGSLRLGAQNLYFEEKGAYTGEVSPLMLAGLCEFVIIGHSERRQYFGDTGETVSKKIQAALKVGLKPILCVGEKLEENEAGRTEEVLVGQLESSLAGVERSEDLIVAYEPVWAIGTGKAATSEQANQTMGFVRQNIAHLYDNDLAAQMRILYGGSMTPDNVADLIRQPEIDGGLVGGASLKADQFVSMVRQVSEIV